MTLDEVLNELRTLAPVGYSRLMGADKRGPLDAYKSAERTFSSLRSVRTGGASSRVMGDGVLVEFSSAVDAVAGAIEVQREMAQANESLAADRRIVLRVGINLGDVIGEGSDLYGEA